jgi:hypothetical protein
MAVWDKKQNNHNNQNIKAVACQELDVCGRRLRVSRARRFPARRLGSAGLACNPG